MIDESSIIVESPYLSRLDLKTEIQFIEKGQEIVVPSLYIPDGTREVEIIIPRSTSADKSLWSDDGSEILFELEYSKDGSAWYPAGAFGAIGGIIKDIHPLSKQAFEVPQTEGLFSCDFDQIRYRLRTKCDSASSQKLSPLILFHSDPAPRVIPVKKNSVGYVSVQKATGSSVTSLTTPTLSIGASSNRAVAAIIGNYYLQTVTAAKFGGSGGTSMNAVPGAEHSGSPWARLTGYLLKESEGVTADGTVYASFSASASGYLTGISADSVKGLHASSGVAPTQTTNGTAISANVVSASGELVIGAAVTYTSWSSSPTIAVGSGQTQRSTDAIGSTTRMTVSTETAASTSESTSFNPNDYVSYPFYGESTITAMIAFSLEEETGGGGAGEYDITGAVTITASPASSMDFTRNSSISGAVTATFSTAASMTYDTIFHYDITGAVTTTLGIGAGLDYTQNPSISGDISVAHTVAADMYYTQHPSISGDNAVQFSVASGFDYTLNASISGDVTPTFTVASAMDYTSAADSITGDVTISMSILGSMAYQFHGSLAGDVTMVFSPSSAMGYNTEEILADQPSGGWIFRNEFEAEQQRLSSKRRKREQLLDAAKEIEDDVEREIAVFLQKQELEDERQHELARLRNLAEKHADKVSEDLYGERVTRALTRAVVQGNYSAIEALEREMKAMREEEDFIMQATSLILND